MTGSGTDAGSAPDRVLVLVIGDEVVDGSITDRNGARLARAIRERGGEVSGIVLVGDEEEAIAEAVTGGLRRADGVVACGGIGPTVDDRTREGVSRALGAGLTVEEGWAERLAARHPRARDLPGMERQSRLPAGALAIDNPVGTALGFGMDVGGGGWVLVLPGVPAELEAMLAGPAGAFLDARVAGPSVPLLRVGVAGVPESVIARRVEALPELDGLRLASYPHHGTVDLLLRPEPGAGEAEGRERLGAAERALVETFGAHVYEVGGRGLVEVVLDLLRARGETLAVAESCTGGGLGAALTDVPGASDVFWGGVISYANEAKVRLLGVPEAVLEARGAVSEEVARAMAAGARETSEADWAVAITGVAGPSGGTEEKPVGTVWIAVSGPREAARRFRMPGGRGQVRRRSVTAALDLVRRLATDEI